MEQRTISIKELRKRKLFLVLPLITLPFLTILFWSLGGGKSDASITQADQKEGFNIHLPIPKFKEDSTLDKMSYYDKASLDSIKLREQIKKDPNYLQTLNAADSTQKTDYDIFGNGEFRKGKTALNSGSYQDPTTEKIYEKLRSLQKVINEPALKQDSEQDMREFEYRNSTGSGGEDMKELEKMMNAMSAPSEPDPELKQLGGMLENILDIQHPERVTEKLRAVAKTQKAKAYSVNKKKEDDNLSLLQNEAKALGSSFKKNSFYSADEDTISGEFENSLEAVVHQSQTIVSGSTVKLRLTSDVFINGVPISKNTFFYGIASLKGERLEIKIDNVKYRNSIFPVNLGVYDMDGIVGIYIPGAINRDVAKASADRSIQSLGLAGLSDSWGTQAAGMGVEAAKTLLSKKVKLIKVVVKAGYRVLLYDEKQSSSN